MLIRETYPLYLKFKKKKAGREMQKAIFRHVRDGVLCGEGPGLLGKGLEMSVYRGPYCVVAG